MTDICMNGFSTCIQNDQKQENVPKRRYGTRSEQNTPFPLPFP